jgi:hypothetical protein
LNNREQVSAYDHYSVVKKTLEMHSEHDAMARLASYAQMTNDSVLSTTSSQLTHAMKAKRFIRTLEELETTPLPIGSIIVVGSKSEDIVGTSTWVVWNHEKAELIGFGETEDLDWFLLEDGIIQVLFEPKK